MRRLLLNGFIVASVAAAFWIVGSSDDGGTGSGGGDGANAASAEGPGARTFGEPEPLPRRRSQPGLETAAATSERGAREDARGDESGVREDGRSRGGSGGSDVERALRGSSGSGSGSGDGSERDEDRARQSLATEDEPETELEEPSPEPVIDLEAQAAELAESLGLLADHELEGRVDRAVDDDSLAGPALDQAREEARQSALADAAIVEALVLQRYGPDASPAQLRQGRGLAYTLLSSQSEAWRNQMLVELSDWL